MTNQFAPFCSGREETIYLFLDGELSPSQRGAFESHLQTCQACRALLAETEILFARFADLDPVAPPPEKIAQAVAEIMASLPNHYAPPRPAMAGQVVLIGQMIIGLALLFITVPQFVASYRAILPALSRPDALELLRLVANGWALLNERLANWVQGQWAQVSSFAALNISPEAALIIVTTFVLAWLLGNGLLLRGGAYPLRNGGSS